MVEAAEGAHALIERPLAGMAERRMAEVVGKRQGFGQVLVEAEPARQRTRDLGHFQRMGEPRAEMVALVGNEDLRLVLEPAKGGRMDHPVAVAAEFVASRGRLLGMQTAARTRRIGRPGGARPCAHYSHGPCP